MRVARFINNWIGGEIMSELGMIKTVMATTLAEAIRTDCALNEGGIIAYHGKHVSKWLSDAAKDIYAANNLEAKVRKLEAMIDEGIGWEDLKNDTHDYRL